MSGEELTIAPLDFPMIWGRGADHCPGVKDRTGFTVVWVLSLAVHEGL